MTKEDVLEPVEEDASLDRFTPISPHQRPVIHQVASAPMPDHCEFSFFDPSEQQCREVLQEPSTTIPELFAVLRQWVPQVQKNIDLIGNEILNRGCGVNDRDGLTDMSLLHYCCKAGAPGIGDADRAAGFARHLVALGADPNLRSRWTNMRALHYAAYFDVPQLIGVVAQASQPGDMDATCSDFDFGTALHIAASNLCTSAVSCLLELGANPAFKDDKGQYPADVVPDPLNMPPEMADAAALAKELRRLLREALPQPTSLPLAWTPPALSEKARLKLASLGIALGDRVVIAGRKVGSLQFCGNTEFSGGLWAGVVLDKAEGKNDGSVAGVQYFTCQLKHGVFAPLSKISKALERFTSGNKVSTLARHRHIDLSAAAVPPKSNTRLGGLSQSLSSSSSSLESRHGRRPRPHPLHRQRLAARQQREHISSSSWAAPAPGPRSASGMAANSTAGYRSRTPSASSSVCGGGAEMRPGDRVLVVGQRTGVVHFYGKTSFAPGHWLGIALDTPSGKNDGSVAGVRYFDCPPRHGIFAPPSRVQRIHGSVDCLSELSSSHLNHPSSSGESRQKCLGVIRRSFSTSSAIAPPKETSRRNPVSSKNQRNRLIPHRRRWSSSSGGGSVPRGSSGSVYTSANQVRLHQGMQVLLNSANEMACIRYVGTTDFSPGLWLGLELRGPKGKNDGSVGGRRYFTCRPGHGVLVRPSRVTYRGINGSRLVDEKT
ncbi:CAP-Gly domain-containing linker protein 4-like isoform X1 [Syngnathus typhle]|uniref:CAP-Gly domain-containing linker protein 4-like isoform X1 n=1 Tax=Syngnathus typhle TaxID=161592 RepID=UPI002A6AD77A|nr:CAP-Gly domain-containing linker protein 4-like isoform X1 [Syngnathus typhle]